jgi:hypothetical protein
MTGNKSNRPGPAQQTWVLIAARAVGRLGPVLFAGYLLTALGGTAEPGQNPPLRAAEPAATSGFRGSGSCSAVACHGSIAPQPGEDILRNEHTTWISDDRHSRAYETLFDARSERIARRLATDRNRYQPAHEDPRCLACHTTPRSEAALAATAWMNSDGVGCESCHGASRRWLGPHTTFGWKESTDLNQKADVGFFDTKDLARRAEICAGCHVGKVGGADYLGRDVNHDLIAAGHPRLFFEHAAFLANMPPHWNEKGVNADPVRSRNGAADFPARAWALGKLVTLRAAIELQNGRANAALDRQKPWPEFTEYGCFSCHHSLRDDAWRRRAHPSGGRIGSPRWGSWTTPLCGELLAEFKPLLGADLAVDPADSLRRLSAEMTRTVPDAAIVKRESQKAEEEVGRCLRALGHIRFDAGKVERLITAIDRPDAWDRVACWDEAAQRYLALVPLRQSWVALAPLRKTDQDRLATRLEDLRAKLMFPAGFDSPTGFDPGKLRQGR